MVDDEEPTNWEFQYSNDCTSIKVVLEIETDALQSINTISDLRNTNPNDIATRNGGKYIELLGYNTALDKPIVYYKWNPNSLASDNGGNIIKVAGISTGRWELLDLFEKVDVRDFGIFGAASKSSASDNMSNMIYTASQYASSIGKPLYFPNNSSLGLVWYKINNLTLTNCKFDKNTRLFGNSGTSNTVYVDENSNLTVYSGDIYQSTFHIKGEIVRTSYAPVSLNDIPQQFEPTYKLIIDSTPSISGQYSFSDLIVDVLAPVEWVEFNDCIINSVENIGGSCSFGGKTRLTQSMFQPSLDLISIDILDNNVIIDIDDFPSTNAWMKLKKKQNPTEMDFKGRTVSISNYFMDWGNAKVITYKNAKFSNYNISGKTITFENCTGSFQIYRTDTAFELYLKNSDMELTTNRDFHILNSINSTFTHSYNRTIDIIECKNSDIKSAIVTLGTPSFVGCTIHNNISQANISGTNIDFEFINNEFVGNGKHTIASTVANTKVIGFWIGNINYTSSHFITINRTNLLENESSHTYVYENNTGKNTLQKYSAKWTDSITYVGSKLEDTYTTPMNSKTFAFMSSSTYLGYIGKINDSTFYLTTCRFFSVGTTGIRCIIGGHIRNDFVADTNPPVMNYTLQTQCPISTDFALDSSLPQALVFDNGYNWKICRAQGFMEYIPLTNGAGILPVNKTYTVSFEIKPTN